MVEQERQDIKDSTFIVRLRKVYAFNINDTLIKQPCTVGKLQIIIQAGLCPL